MSTQVCQDAAAWARLVKMNVRLEEAAELDTDQQIQFRAEMEHAAQERRPATRALPKNHVDV